jgi:peptidoglycan/LPS O-acetylase OafA/YrhL
VSDRRSRIPSLDGLRAVAVILVVFSHLAGTRGFPLPARLVDEIDPGALGVRVFFVISGFLISRILFDELATTGRVRLGRFYFRRTLRIFPPYYVFLAAVVAMMGVGLLQIPARDVLAAVTYTANYFPERTWKLSHTWSLAVEEHFYLVWPAVLALLGRRRGLIIAAGFVALAPGLRVVYWLFAPSLEIPVRSETIADAVAIGCLLAGLRESLHARDWYRRLLASPAMVAVPLAAVVAHGLEFWRPLDFVLGYTIANIGIALAIDRVVTHPHDRVGRVLNSRVMVAIGLISYSIYLWQELFLDRYCSRTACAFPYNLGVTLLAALASYCVVERPSLALRKWLEPRVFRRRPATASRPGVPEPTRSTGLASAGSRVTTHPTASVTRRATVAPTSPPGGEPLTTT